MNRILSDTYAKRDEPARQCRCGRWIAQGPCRQVVGCPFEPDPPWRLWAQPDEDPNVE